MTAGTVDIHYRRLPGRVEVFRQAVVEACPEHTVTLLERAPLTRQVRVSGRVVLDPGAPVVWFTYPGRWYDVGRFHRLDGTFTGLYANLLTPVRMSGSVWETTDLFLDVWLGADGHLELLDEDELERAVGNGWLDPRTARTVVEEAERLLRAARDGDWPGPEVRYWDLARARAACTASSPIHP
jgi:predicted RNA-binding protein associated with RNAse of E/G family